MRSRRGAGARARDTGHVAHRDRRHARASVIEYRRNSDEEITHVVLAQMVFNNTALFR